MSLNFEKFEHFLRLQKEQENYFRICNEKISNWQKFKDDYLTLRKRLETLPHELRYDVMVPISKVAFMTGRLINTNEILVLLGDNWFVEKSTKQSCDLIDRRLKNIEKFLEDLNKEKKNLQDQIDWTQSLLKEKGEYVNIEEKFEDAKPKTRKEMSDEEKKELRKKLQEKALKTSIELESQIKNDLKSLYKPKEEIVVEEEDKEKVEVVNEGQNFMNRLQKDIENLDIGEKFEEEDEQLRDLIKDYSQNINRENNLEIEKRLKKQTKKVKWSDIEKIEKEEIDEEYEDDEDYNETETEEEEEEEEEEGEVALSHDENLKIEPIRIVINHTKNETLDEQERRLKLSREKPEINSPGDLYTFFNKPRSILKKTSSVEAVDTSSLLPETKKEPLNAEQKKFEPFKAFTGEIVEKTCSNLLTQNQQEVKKPISKFKASKFSHQNK